MKRCYHYAFLVLLISMPPLQVKAEEKPEAPKNERVAVKDGEITKIVIADFHWERQITTTYVIEPGRISITDNSKEPLDKTVDTNKKQDKMMRAVIDAIDTVYKGRYSDENVYDGVNVNFTFYLKDGSEITTFIHHLRIDSYAKLTQYVSKLVDPDIHYHQYRMKRITEDE